MSDYLGTAVEQHFRTQPIANIGLALYMLSIRAPDAAFTPVRNYIFPLSPQMVRKEVPAYNTIYDKQGDPSTLGVQREIDMFGAAPPLFVIGGTTGWKLHSTDGYLWSGKVSIQRMQSVLAEFTGLNQEQMLADNPNLYRLEFYDYWMDEYWEVAPVGPQQITQTAERPILSYYQLRLAGVRPVSAPISEPEAKVLSTILGPVAGPPVLGLTQTFLTGVLAQYGP